MNNLETIAVLVGILLQTIALLAVIYQLKKVNTSIRVSAQAAIYQQSSAFRTLLVEHPSLRKYFFDCVKIEEDSEDYDRVKTIAEMFLNYLEHIVIQQESLRSTDFTAWSVFVYRTISASPIMRKQLNERPEFYSEDLIRLYDVGRSKES